MCTSLCTSGTVSVDRVKYLYFRKQSKWPPVWRTMYYLVVGESWACGKHNYGHVLCRPENTKIMMNWLFWILHCKVWVQRYIMEFKDSTSSDKLPKTDNWNWGWFKLLDAPRQQQRSVSTALSMTRCEQWCQCLFVHKTTTLSLAAPRGVNKWRTRT